MYARRIKGLNRSWGSMYLSSKLRSHDKAFYQSIDCTTTLRAFSSYCASVKGQLLCLLPALSNTHADKNIACSRFNSCQFRGYSSEGDGRNTSEDNKHEPIGDDFNIRKTKEKLGSGDTKYYDAHARLAEQDQLEWLNNEKLAIESKMKESPFLTRREKFKNEFIRRILPWEKIHISFETFPYYVNEHTKDILVECVASHLKNKEVTDSYGARLKSSSGRILLRSALGLELYRERMVKALARELQVPLLVLDSSVLVPYDLGDGSSESESDENMEDGEEETSESEIEDENDASNEEEWTGSAEAKSDDDVVDVQVTAEAALKKLIPYTLEDFEKRVSGESEGCESSKSERGHSSGASNRPLKKGDRVKYIGPSRHIEAHDRIKLGKIETSVGLKNAYTVICSRPLPNGQRGEVYEVDGENVAVILDVTNDTKQNKAEGGENLTKESVKALVYWLDVKDIELDPDAEAENCYIAMEALRDVLNSMKPLVVYFPDSSLWLSGAVPRSGCKDFINKVQEIFDQITGPVVLICGQNKVETGSKDKEKLTMILPSFGRLAKLPVSPKHLTEGLKGTKRSSHNKTSSLFTNVVSIYPPKDEDLLRTFNKQVEADGRLVILRSNLKELYEVLEENEMFCIDLLDVNADGVILTRQKAEKVVGWAKNHHLSACTLPNVKGERLFLPLESIDIAIMRLKEQENVSRKPSHNSKNLAKDEYESNFVSAVVPPGEIGVKFEDVGALEQVKKALKELVVLPMKKLELFTHGNLLQPCKGILLFGPPGTGKTLLAKALATEAGANFISITGSTLTSKWFGDAEKLTKALFSFASKLAPVVIFVDEVDSVLGARGGASEHEATRRMRNEFMAAWDGLRSKESQRILILGATNRPFDLDDAVIRRLPRRIYVDLPDAANRVKILKIFLAGENIEPDFKFDEIANATEGYSGSDLKNLCIAAAYRPVQELLEAENTRGKSEVAPALRPLNLNDFILSKEKVGPSVAYDAASMNELRKWNELYGEGGSRRKSPFGFGDR